MNSDATKEQIREARGREGLLQSAEMIAIRGHRSRAEFARMTGLALSTIIRWENDLLVQSRANDRYLRLLRESAKRELDVESLQTGDPATPDPGRQAAVLAALRQEAPIADLARKYDVSPGQIEEGKQRFLAAGAAALAAPRPARPGGDAAELRERVGALTMQRDLLATGLRSALASMEPGPLVDALGSVLSIIAPTETTSSGSHPAPSSAEPEDDGPS